MIKEISKNNNQEELDLLNDPNKYVDKKESFIEIAQKTIRAMKEKIIDQKEQNKISYQKLQDDLKNFSTALEGTKNVYEKDKIDAEQNQETAMVLQKLEEIQAEIDFLWEDLENKIENAEKDMSHPSPEKIKQRITIREASPEEKERFEERIPSYKKEALKTCSRIFNKCDYPWYLTGSIAFLINAKESKKQPDDIDIIFHEKDFDKMSQEFKALGFETGIAQNTGCPFIKGKIEVKDENGNMKQIDMEAFGQQTEKPNGLINPGAKDTKYQIIKNKTSDNEQENFNILDKSGQVELYFKSLINEIKGFNFESFIEGKNEQKNEDKSKKFINRLANLFELSENNKLEIIRKTRELCKNEEELLLLRNFIDISKKFREEKHGGKGLENVYDDGHLQIAVENLKKEISREQELLKDAYFQISKEMKNISNMDRNEKNNLIDKIDNEIYSKKNMIDNFLKSHQEINNEDESHKDLPIYIFISKFKENFINPFCEKMLIFKKELI